MALCEDPGLLVITNQPQTFELPESIVMQSHDAPISVHPESLASHDAWAAGRRPMADTEADYWSGIRFYEHFVKNEEACLAWSVYGFHFQTISFLVPSAHLIKKGMDYYEGLIEGLFAEEAGRLKAAHGPLVAIWRRKPKIGVDEGNNLKFSARFHLMTEAAHTLGLERVEGIRRSTKEAA